MNLQVIDWGGTGETVVLLTGLGGNAHVYGQSSFQWNDHFHVIGITRRGYLPSSQPADGYDVPTRVADDIAVLDSLKIDRVVLVGHSIAGSDSSALAVSHPERVDKVVYWDALDLSQRNEVPGPPAFFGFFTEADTKSIWHMQPPTRATKEFANRSLQSAHACNLTMRNTLSGPTPDAVPAARSRQG